MGLQVIPAPAGYRAAPSGLLTLDARSPYLLQGDAPPAQPGEQQPFPNTAAGLIAALGSPGGVVVGNVQGAYLCANVGNQLDALGLGPAMIQDGGALDSREAVGLGQTASFASKVAIELLGGGERYRVAPAGSAFADANGSIVATLTVFRCNPNANVAQRLVTAKFNGATGWWLDVDSGHIHAYVVGASTVDAVINVDVRDGGWHYALVVVNDVAKTIALHSDVGSNTSGAYIGSATNNGRFTFGSDAIAFSGQIKQPWSF